MIDVVRSIEGSLKKDYVQSVGILNKIIKEDGEMENKRKGKILISVWMTSTELNSLLKATKEDLTFKEAEDILQIVEDAIKRKDLDVK